MKYVHGRWKLLDTDHGTTLDYAPERFFNPIPLQTLEVLGRRMGPITTPTLAAVHLVRMAARHSFHGDGGTFGASRIIDRDSVRWLAIARLIAPLRARITIYQWSLGAWRRYGARTRLPVGDLGGGGVITAAELTGSHDPDFVLHTGGADNSYLDVVSDARGRWQGVPFEDGYGKDLITDAQGVRGHVVETATNACGCATGPDTYGWERYVGGSFRPTRPPGLAAVCTPGHLTRVADPTGVLSIRFSKAHCFGGWALAIGTGDGFADHAVGLFEQRGSKWTLITLDDGQGLDLDPGSYALPATLVHRLAAGLGPAIAASSAATEIWHRFTRHDQMDGLVALSGVMTPDDGSQWMLTALQLTSPLTVGVYRWSGTEWQQLAVIRNIRTDGSIVGLPGWYRIQTTTGSATPSFVITGQTPHWTTTIRFADGLWSAT